MDLFMKKILLLLIISSALFMACASNNTKADDDYSEDYDSEIIQTPETTDNFLGDYNPFQIENLMVLSKSSNSVKPKELNNNYLVPRTNTVELQFRNGINAVTVILNKTEREKIIQTCNTFLTQYEERSIPHHNVSSKTAYYNSKCSVYFGVTNASNGTDENDYFVNCEFIDKKPYLVIKFLPTRCDENSTFTPKVSIYMSPTQIREFISIMNQEHLNELVKTLNEKAYVY